MAGVRVSDSIQTLQMTSGRNGTAGKHRLRMTLTAAYIRVTQVLLPPTNNVFSIYHQRRLTTVPGIRQ